MLLIKRAKPPYQGLWTIPGGKLEFGERLEDAVRREVREETNVEIDIIGLVAAVDSHVRHENGEMSHYVLIDYAAIWRSGEIAAGDDAAEAIWVSRRDADALVSWDKTRDVIDAAGALVAAQQGDR